MVSWGKEWESLFDLAIFIRLDNDIRMERLKKREFERYGDELKTNIERKRNYEAFINWANQYENPEFDGRSLRVHNNWIEKLDCKVLRIDGALELKKKVSMVLYEITS